MNSKKALILGISLLSYSAFAGDYYACGSDTNTKCVKNTKNNSYYCPKDIKDPVRKWNTSVADEKTFAANPRASVTGKISAEGVCKYPSGGSGTYKYKNGIYTTRDLDYINNNVSYVNGSTLLNYFKNVGVNDFNCNVNVSGCSISGNYGYLAWTDIDYQYEIIVTGYKTPSQSFVSSGYQVFSHRCYGDCSYPPRCYVDLDGVRYIDGWPTYITATGTPASVKITLDGKITIAGECTAFGETKTFYLGEGLSIAKNINPETKKYLAIVSSQMSEQATVDMPKQDLVKVLEYLNKADLSNTFLCPKVEACEKDYIYELFNGEYKCVKKNNLQGCKYVEDPNENTTDPHMACDEFSEFLEYGGHYYAMTKNKLTWSEANSRAKSAGGYLAIPNSAGENSFLAQHWSDSWIGIYDPNYTQNNCILANGSIKNCPTSPGRFVTVKGGKPTYANWYSTEPNNEIASDDIDENGVARISPLGEHWAVIARNGTWYDEGNHYAPINGNPNRHHAIFEFEQKPVCSAKEDTDVLPAPYCVESIVATNQGTTVANDYMSISDYQSHQCLKDPNGILYCPSQLAQCGEEWDYYNGEKVQIDTRPRPLMNIVWGKIGNNYIGGSQIVHWAGQLYVGDVTNVHSFILKQAWFDDGIVVKINGKDIYEYNYYDCEDYETSYHFFPNVNAKPYLKSGNNTIDVYVNVIDDGEGYVFFEGVTYDDDFSIIGATNSSISRAGNVNLPYYKYLCQQPENTQHEEYETTKKAEGFAPVVKNNCKRKKYVCKADKNRPCAYVSGKWQCSPFPCYNIDNNDAGNTKGTKSTDTKAGATDSKNQGFNNDGSCSGQIRLFNGTDRRCVSKTILGGLGKRCCADENGLLSFISQCDAEEKELAKYLDKNKKQAHEVGEYCAEELDLLVTSICIRWKRTFCTFGSVLSRIINEQGRPQIGRGWGDPKEPDCKGFTPEEFQKLDFDKIDLSEFTNDIMEKVSENIANKLTGELPNLIQNKVDAMYNSSSGGE